MTRINIAIPIFAFIKSGGMRVITNMANEWVRIGHFVEFIVTNETQPYFPTKAQITRIRAESKRDKLFALIKYLNENYEKYDAIIATYFLTVYPIFLTSLKKKNFKKNYYYIQAYEPELLSEKKGFSKLLNVCLAYFSYKLPFVRIVNAELYTNYKQIKSKYIVPPGLDLKIYYQRQSYWNKCTPIRVGCIGRNEEWKGSQDVADAIEILLNKSFPVELIVAFNPVKCSSYKLVKPDGDNNLAEYYRDIDILVAPAKLQLGAIHYPVIEAMACGTPVITTGYYPANEENAFLVPISKPQRIAEAIEYISMHYEEAIRRSKKAAKTLEKFDWTKTSLSFMQIIKENMREN